MAEIVPELIRRRPGLAFGVDMGFSLGDMVMVVYLIHSRILEQEELWKTGIGDWA